MMFWIAITAGAAPVLDVEGERLLLETLQQALEDAEALGRAAGLAQNALPPRLDAACVPAQVGSAAAAAAFTQAWGASLDDVRRFAAEVEASVDLPTLVPLRGAEATALRQRLLVRASRTQAAHAGASRALKTHLGTYLTRCPGDLPAGSGWKRAGAVARDDPADLRAIWVRQSGYLCTDAPHRVEPGPLLLEQPTACWSDAEVCTCTPVELLAGSVL